MRVAGRLLASRVAEDGVAKRPLLLGAPAGEEYPFALAKLEEIYQERGPMYEQADVTVSLLKARRRQAAPAKRGKSAEERMSESLPRRARWSCGAKWAHGQPRSRGMSRGRGHSQRPHAMFAE